MRLFRHNRNAIDVKNDSLECHATIFHECEVSQSYVCSQILSNALIYSRFQNCFKMPENVFMERVSNYGEQEYDWS